MGSDFDIFLPVNDMTDREDNKLVAVVRIRGRVKVSNEINETLKRLRLESPNNCIILKLNSSYGGMIEKCKNYIAYGEVDKEIAEKLFAKFLNNVNADEVFDGKKNINEIRESMPFRLHPPRHGYKSIKKSFTQGGALGYVGNEINDLIKRMI